MIVIPMVGLSSRFFDAGYRDPKYKLPLWDSDVFSWVMKSFDLYLESEKFLFICRDDQGAPEFVSKRARELGIADFSIVVLSENTRGQAETVYLGTTGINEDAEIFVFNIDTIRPEFRKPTWLPECDGYLEVFVGDGDHWSFVKTDSTGWVIETVEKRRISNLCSDGLYFFKRLGDFRMAFESALINNDSVRGEFYVAPLYNQLIQSGKSIAIEMIEKHQIFLCGTPQEYVHLGSQAMPKLKT